MGNILKTLNYEKGKYMKDVTKEDIYVSSITGAYDAAMKKLLSKQGNFSTTSANDDTGVRRMYAGRDSVLSGYRFDYGGRLCQ